jgi:Ca2+-binding EF-hand superfamily protein
MIKLFTICCMTLGMFISGIAAEEVVAEKKKGKGDKGERLQKHFEAVDADQSGDVSLEEFLNHKRKKAKGERAKKKPEGDEAVEKKAKKGKRKGPKMSKEEIQERKTEAFKNADEDSSGTLTKEEFASMMKSFMKKMKERRGGSKKHAEKEES